MHSLHLVRLPLVLSLSLFAIIGKGQGNEAAMQPVNRSLLQSQTDVLWLDPNAKPSSWQPLALERYEGRVIGISSQSIRLEPIPSDLGAASRSQDFNLDRLVRWQLAPRSEAESQAIKLTMHGDARQAARQWIVAATEYKTKETLWRRSYLIAQSYPLLFSSGEYGALFDVIKQNSLADRIPTLCAMLPLCWTNESLPQIALEQASTELPSANAANRLLAASWLLPTAQKDQAIQALRAIAEAKPPSLLAKIASIQLWRELTPDQFAEQQQLLRTQVEELPIALQAGPLIVLAEKYRAIGQADEAADLLLSVGHLYEQPANAIRTVR